MPAPTAYTLTGSVRETRHATLFRGLREADQHPVLLKVIAEDAPSALDTVRLEHEHALLDGMDVPGIVKTLGLTKIGERTALVLEDAGDRSLEDALGGTGLDLPHFLDTSIAMAEILESVHRQRIIHQDIKPQHFFRKGESGPLTLIDFGAAMRVSVDEQGMTSVAQPEGTLAYMSPEQTGRMNRAVDRRTDLYSLGVSYYQLLTGVLPFQSSDTLGLVHSHIARLPTAPHEVISSVPPVLSAIILKLLSKNAEDRYQDVAGLKADL
jgi:serine/threonine protein kinase